MKNVKKLLAVIFSASFCIFCILFPHEVKSAVEGAIYRCISVVVPSLYAMMAASALLLGSGAAHRCGRLISPVTRLFFGINGEFGAVLLFSLIAGYPVGAKMISGLYREGRIPKKAAEVLSGVCFGSGTAFVFGCAASSAAVGRLLLISTVAADLSIAAILSPYFRRYLPKSEIQRKTAVSAEMFTEGIVSAGRSMLEICFCIMIFSVFGRMLQMAGADRIFSCILPKEAFAAILDVTALSEVSVSLPMAAALLAFGGICVFLQISAIFGGELSVIPLAVIRAAAAVVSGLICRLLMPYFLSGEAVDVFASAGELYRERSPIPSVMLVIMTGALVGESAALRRKKAG